MILLKLKANYVSSLIKTLRWLYVLLRFEMKGLAMWKWSVVDNNQFLPQPCFYFSDLSSFLRMQPRPHWFPGCLSLTYWAHLPQSLCPWGSGILSSFICMVESLTFSRPLLQYHIFLMSPFLVMLFKMTLPGFYSLLFPHPLISYHFPACYIFYLFCSIFSWDSKLHDGKDPCLFCILPHPKCLNSAWHLIHNNNKTYPLQVNEYIPSDGHLKLNLYKSLQTEAHRDCAGLRIGFYNKLIQQVF